MNEVKEYLKHFEDIAVKILDSCHKSNAYRTKFILLQTLDVLGGKSCMFLASRGKRKMAIESADGNQLTIQIDGRIVICSCPQTGNCLDFIAHDACQQHLNNIWYGMMSPQIGLTQIILLCWLPFLIPVFSNQRLE